MPGIIEDLQTRVAALEARSDQIDSRVSVVEDRCRLIWFFSPFVTIEPGQWVYWRVEQPDYGWAFVGGGWRQNSDYPWDGEPLPDGAATPHVYDGSSINIGGYRFEGRAYNVGPVGAPTIHSGFWAVAINIGVYGPETPRVQNQQVAGIELRSIEAIG